jgi:hypothetical protein
MTTPTSLTTTNSAATTPRARRSSVILTNRMCEKRVTKRSKIYDRKCRGLYVSIIPAGAATLNFKFTDSATKGSPGHDGRTSRYRLRWIACWAQRKRLRRSGPQHGILGGRVSLSVEAIFHNA